ncbi:MaoC/PaaZ C-terminal domain-containing protein [Nonomuraea lactucae]|uniref:MaoC/PaaZ C-terminal domain-containing protein n=1 Tax=Nonomuraea lactucae TaxID=2249762 RepID=UPI000DE4B0C1|nr:MaoC/PaaZ C-terminal domain-containing protein [Nonomuraea lactucae]
MTAGTFDVNALRAMIGRELTPGPWTRVSQSMVDTYGEVTGEEHWLHNDPERARAESPFGGRTIVQGSFLVAHCARLPEELLVLLGKADYVLNYGYDRVRFIRPVPVGSRVRGRLTPCAVDERPALDGHRRYLLVLDVVVEPDDGDGPAAGARWLCYVVASRAAG